MEPFNLFTWALMMQGDLNCTNISYTISLLYIEPSYCPLASTASLSSNLIPTTSGNKGLSRASFGHIDNMTNLDHTATQPQQECYDQAPTWSNQGNLTTAAQEAEDIVAAHCKHNCTPQLPSSTQLLATRQQQTSSTTSAGLCDQETLPITQVPAKSQENLSATETAIHGHGVLDMDMTKPVGPAIEGITKLHSGLRKKAHLFIAQCYQWDPENDCEQNIKIARHLLGSCHLFLKNGVDDEGHTNNFTHPVFMGVIGYTSVGQLFPEVFSLEFQELLWLLLQQLQFLTTYSPVHVKILGLMSKCNTSPIHKAKTQTTCIQWAQLGSNGMAKQEPGMVSSGFDIDLT
ncbi:hypothetical protein EDC04DRAFT_2610919 [Pisolithus marmoratus]|nr:hypothetical protein EDC04DRAFT_2610919 [Pisolithus marmoratus]